MLAMHVTEICDVQYSTSGILALSRRLGCSIIVSRPVPHITADKNVASKHISDTITAITLHVDASYSVGCINTAGFVKAPFSARGIRAIGGHETVQTIFGKSTKALGALGG